jgi:hypothetical protein
MAQLDRTREVLLLWSETKADAGNATKPAAPPPGEVEAP